MAYIPNTAVSSPDRISAEDVDLTTHLAILEEKWTTFYPQVPWRMIDYVPSEAVQSSTSEAPLSGQTGTKVDDVYGEAVPVDLAGNFVQPHGNPDVSAPDRKQHKAERWLNVHEVMEDGVDELTLESANNSRDIKVMLLCSLCDKQGITVNVGDEFDYLGQTWEVKEVTIPPKGRWKYTTIPLYLSCSCTIAKRGS